jgi:hypothetical protein
VLGRPRRRDAQVQGGAQRHGHREYPLRSSARPEQFIEQIAEPCLEHIELGVGNRNAMANRQAGSRIGLISLSVSFAKVSYDCNHAKDDRRKQDRNNNWRTSTGRRDSQRHESKEERCDASNRSPLSQQPSERVAVLLFRERPGFWPTTQRRARQPVGNVRWNGQGSDAGAAKLKLGDRPKQDGFPRDAEGFPRNKKVSAKRSEHSHDSDPKSRRAYTQC